MTMPLIINKQPSWQTKSHFAEKEKSPESPIYLNIKPEKKHVNFHLLTLTYTLRNIFIRKWRLKHETKVGLPKFSLSDSCLAAFTLSK